MRTYASDFGWGNISSKFDDARNEEEIIDYLDRFDFQRATAQKLEYRAGLARLYVRKIPPGKKAASLPFDFCCILSMSGFLYPVGMKTLEDVLSFLQEIDAHPVNQQPVTLINMDELTNCLKDVATQMREPTITFAHYSELKGLLESFINTLEQLASKEQQDKVRRPTLHHQRHRLQLNGKKEIMSDERQLPAVF